MIYHRDTKNRESAPRKFLGSLGLWSEKFKVQGSRFKVERMERALRLSQAPFHDLRMGRRPRNDNGKDFNGDLP